MMFRYVQPVIPVVVGVQWNSTNIQELVDFRNSVNSDVSFDVPVDNGNGTASVGATVLSDGDWIYIYLSYPSNVRHAWNFGTCAGTSADGQYMTEHATTNASIEWAFPTI